MAIGFYMPFRIAMVYFMAGRDISITVSVWYVQYGPYLRKELYPTGTRKVAGIKENPAI